jgi:cysteine desulfurase
MAAVLATPGNPSSIHSCGRAARAALETARRTVAAAVGAEAEQVVFTSGGTEANALALHGLDGPVVVSAIEHPSVLEARPDALRLPALSDGIVDLDALDALLATAQPRLVAVMLANNETGVIQPMAEIAARVHAAGARLHVDAVQAFGKIPCRLADLGADTMAISAHKIGGPAGVGALVLAPEVEVRPRQTGGGQELRRRAGTENLAGIVGFAAAVELLPTLDWTRVRGLRDRLEAELAARDEIVIAGAARPRLPNISCVMAPARSAETRLIALDLAGIAVSSGAACSSGKVAASHVLAAMGVAPALARAAIRVSLGWRTGPADIEALLAAWAGARRH